MRKAIRLLTAVGVVCVVGMSQPASLWAQAPSGYFHALTVPPGDVGTCIQGSKGPPAPGRLAVRAQLVMTSRTPSARREVRLTRDSMGTIVGLSDMAHFSTGRVTSEGENVVATMRRDGRVAGYFFHSSIEATGRDLMRSDTASMRRLRESAKQHSRHEVLDAGEQGKVKVLATWLAKRCPG